MTLTKLVKRLKATAKAEDVCQEFPPLSKTQIIQFEQEMELKLPELLKLIYCEVANGGMYLDGMLLPLYSDSEESVHTLYLNWLKPQTAVEDFNDEKNDTTLEWIPGLIPIIDQGGVMYVLLDCNTEGGPVIKCDFDFGPIDFKQEWETGKRNFFDRTKMPFADWVSSTLDQQ